MTVLHRKPGEGAFDHVARLLTAEPLTDGLTDAEIAAVAIVDPAYVRAVRREVVLARTLAEKIAADVGWTGTLSELVRAALVDFGLAACSEGRCTHRLCARVDAEHRRAA